MKCYNDYYTFTPLTRECATCVNRLRRASYKINIGSIVNALDCPLLLVPMSVTSFLMFH